MDAIMLAAGRSTRIGPGQEKQLYRIGGKPMLIISLEKLLSHPGIDRAIITCPHGRVDNIEAIVTEYTLGPCKFIEGGETRQESVYLALQQVQSNRVLIHEAARPLLTVELISRVLEHPDEPAVVPTVDVPFTTSIGDKYMEGELDRARLRNIQLPQVFDTSILRKAHEDARANKSASTEDSMLVFRLGHPVRFVEGDIQNIKVTFPIDLKIAKELIFSDRETV